MLLCPTARLEDTSRISPIQFRPALSWNLRGRPLFDQHALFVLPRSRETFVLFSSLFCLFYSLRKLILMSRHRGRSEKLLIVINPGPREAVLSSARLCVSFTSSFPLDRLLDTRNREWDSYAATFCSRQQRDNYFAASRSAETSGRTISRASYLKVTFVISLVTLEIRDRYKSRSAATRRRSTRTERRVFVN